MGEVWVKPRDDMSISWKESSGRNEGKEGYVFGDISRSLFRKVFKSDDSAAAKTEAEDERKIDCTMNDMWQSFFTQTYEIGKECISQVSKETNCVKLILIDICKLQMWYLGSVESRRYSRL